MARARSTSTGSEALVVDFPPAEISGAMGRMAEMKGTTASMAPTALSEKLAVAIV